MEWQAWNTLWIRPTSAESFKSMDLQIVQTWANNPEHPHTDFGNIKSEVPGLENATEGRSRRPSHY